jgi:transposase-like protein
VSDSLYRGHRFPREIISECVWLYFRFGVSFRDVEELMATRGVLVSYETVRCWCDKFGKQYADGLRRRRARSGDKWHLDEVFLKINGVTHYLWRAVDQNGVVLDILFNRSGIGLPQSAFLAGFYGQLDANRASLLLTNCGVTGQRNEW